MKIRIAVAVDVNGAWNCAGWRSGDAEEPTDDEKMELAVESLGAGEARYWIEAEVQIPVVQVVQGEVMPA